jgi:two-component system, NtrC family, sensor histidine kinase HydH
MPPPQSDELSELAGGFIHELKNHINTLSLNLQLLAEDYESPETPRERKVEISNDFLRFSRVLQPEAKPTDLEAVVRRMVDFLEPTARMQGVAIHWHAEPELPPVMLDAEMFEKVLLNLMLNAEDAMPDGGTLTLQARAEAERVVLDVIDTGCGMEPALAAKVFTPFVTTKKDGNGLGLATSKKIVLAHGGSIAVQSAPGLGSKFTIALPRA